MDRIYQEAVNGRIQYHSEEIGRIKECGGREPIWSEERPLFKRRRGNTRFEPFGCPSDTIGVYRIIYKPTMETLGIGCGVVSARLGVHRKVFLNGGRDIFHKKSGTTSGSATGGHMYRHDTHRKNWMFSWCDIGNKSLAEEYEDLLIKLEKPLFNKEWMGGK